MEENILDTKYDVCKEDILKMRNEKKEWEQIKKYKYLCNEKADIEFRGYPKDYIEKWDIIVEFMKKLEEDNEKATGYIYSDDIENDIDVPKNEHSAWVTFKKHKLMKYGIETTINSEKSALKILKRLKMKSKGEEAGKGLVMGYVQSGKTMNIESVISMSADYGWNIFVILSGTIENLRKQNLDRLKEDIEYAEASNVQWKFYNDMREANISGLLGNEKTRIVTCCLKNKDRLTNLKKWLIDSTDQLTKDKMNVLIIDDEADQASLNTKDINSKERSRINKFIVDIVNCNEFRSMNYISYTATPYGNFLNENGKESLYPKNYIISLPKSKQYIGASEIFGNGDDIKDGLNIIETIEKEEIKCLHQSKKDELIMTESLKKAICWFICTLAIRRYKKSVEPVSMLIHTDVKHIVHSKFGEHVKMWLIDNKQNLMELCEKVYLDETKRFSKKDFFDVMKEYNLDGKHEVKDYPTFEEIREELDIIINSKVSHISISEKGKLQFHKGIHIVIDNCNNKKGIDENGDFVRLAYPEKGSVDFASGLIVIGGNTLARGLTVNGLTTSYFARKVSQADTLMQMGRWFGYRTDYELLPRIWLTNESLEKFREVAYIEHRLRQDLRKYDLGTKPSEYAPRIQASYLLDFLLTARNKSQNATICETTYTKIDSQTVVFEKNVKKQKENLQTTMEFIKQLGIMQNYKSIRENFVWNEIDFDFLKDKLLSKLKFYKNASFFGKIHMFFDWMKQDGGKKLKKWDVIIVNGEKNGTIEIQNIEIRKVNRSKRSKSIDNVIDIGVLRNPENINKAHLYEFDNKDGQLKRPKLFIYIIDKYSKVMKESKQREDLNFESDIVGIDIYVPNINDEGKDRITYSQNMKEEKDEIRL